MNYFNTICFVWAVIGIGSRVMMSILNKKWMKWELEKVYKKEKPLWIDLISIFSILFIISTWMMVSITTISYTYIIATLLTLTLVKIYTLTFKYDEFRQFVLRMFDDKLKLFILNVLVILFSIACLLLGLFVYS